MSVLIWDSKCSLRHTRGNWGQACPVKPLLCTGVGILYRQSSNLCLLNRPIRKGEPVSPQSPTKHAAYSGVKCPLATAL